MIDGMGDESAGAEKQVDRPRLAVWSTVGKAYSIWFAHFNLWLKLSVVPFVFAILLITIGIVWLPVDAHPSGFDAALLTAIFSAIMFLVEIPLLTAWHRVILAPYEAGIHRYQIGKREWRYVMKSTYIMLYVILAVLVLGILFNIGLIAIVGVGPDGGPALSVHLQELMNYAVVLVAYMLVFRFIGHLALALPALALGKGLSRQDAKAALRSNEWHLVGVIAVSMLPIFIAGFAVLALVETSVTSALLDSASYMLALILAPVVVGVISIAYRELVEKPEAAAAASGNDS